MTFLITIFSVYVLVLLYIILTPMLLVYKWTRKTQLSPAIKSLIKKKYILYQRLERVVGGTSRNCQIFSIVLFIGILTGKRKHKLIPKH